MSTARVLAAALLLLCCAFAPVALADDVDVVIDGIDGLARDNVRVHLSLAAEQDAQQSWTSGDIQRMHDAAPSQIREALQALGYYQPTIETTLRKSADKTWQARYLIDKGKRTRLRTVDIQIRGEALTQQSQQAWLEPIVTTYRLQSGKALHHGRYKEARRKLQDALYNAGYLDAQLSDTTLTVHPDEARADLSWVVESGPRYYFGKTRIEQDVLDDELARRFIDIPEGAPFDANRLIQAQLALSDSAYFANVEVDVDRRQHTDHHLPVTILARPQRSQRYTFGLGYGTDTGPRASAGAEFRRLNRKGHRLRTDIRASAVRSTFAADYAIPIRNVATDQMKWYVRAERAKVGDADVDQYSAGWRIEDTWRQFRRALYLQYAFDHFSFGDAPSEESNLLTPGAQVTYKTSDDPLFTRIGFSVTADVHAGFDAVISDTDFVHASISARAVWPLTDRARLLVRGALGRVEAHNFDALPPSQRFFTGGDSSVRGYAFESLSPKNAAGDDIGGRTFNAQSIEVDYLAWKNFGVAAFYDRGGASDTLFGQQVDAVGIGFRYRSPVGMIRLDLAHPLDDPDTDVRLHLTLGPDI